ncbi:MAG: hypothetical protein A2908_03610 [Candidatus Staskawiczbacteria bacterium RIFCSPLOWO2_01_FULL_38_12b]|uniref:Uncharacterized protein n=1 Tax=Candidatus Staskawiczbacteria bacterium RIFCSPLOWO2_01_FULL_38_12b TaxID=1802214 RepID=A0A1G2IDF7_9BACT|nr:MAG: hypothetical protein A2908_03610 [Candidatus Staskawiczbacteria bacterium RIFCSPLOWO2_01_FULL_38_12b]
MKSKIEEKNKAIELRRQGFSYSEILKQIPVAKSSLSLWLRSVKLAKRQTQRLTEKRLAAVIRGGARKRDQRIILTKQIKDKARDEIGILSKRELWLIGIALYWAEGSKEKMSKSSKVLFSNSDPYMIKIFIRWLIEAIKLPQEKISFNIVLHKNNKHRIQEVNNYWLKHTGFTSKSFGNMYFKKNIILTKRKNIGENYFGLLRVGVRESSTLNRKIQGWTEGIYLTN